MISIVGRLFTSICTHKLPLYSLFGSTLDYLDTMPKKAKTKEEDDPKAALKLELERAAKSLAKLQSDYAKYDAVDSSDLLTNGE